MHCNNYTDYILYNIYYMRCSDGAILTRSGNLNNTLTTVRQRTRESDDGKIKMNNYADHK